jgi:heme-degrading monooxygenase HmoA
MIAQIVRFKSGLPAQEVPPVFEARAPQYRAVPGLVQKIYLSFPDTGEHGAVYIWDTAQAMQAFRTSDLARSIPHAYQIQGDPAIDVGQIELVLRDEPARLPVRVPRH